MVAVGDPTVIDFDVLPNPRMIRVLGRRVGVTDLTIVTARREQPSTVLRSMWSTTWNCCVRQLKQRYPDGFVQLGQMREHVIVEGQARSPAQAQQILDTIRIYLASAQTPQRVRTPSGRGTAGSCRGRTGQGRSDRRAVARASNRERRRFAWWRGTS